MTAKPKVLFVTESRNLASGFGTYAKEILQRIYDSGKFELAEFVCYASPDEFKSNDWLVYNNSLVSGQELEEINQNPLIQWGMKRFDRAALDFKPDVVCTYRDPWMDSYISDSPFLPFFEWIWMPTVDSDPQKSAWIQKFKKCSRLLSYSHYGKEILENQTHGRLNVFGIASPAMEDVFDIVVDKKSHKESLGINPNSIIFGTVMRNQKRKMFAELIRSFKKYLDKCDKETYEKSFLYLHTSFPEKTGWDITELAHEFGILNKLLTTYLCRKCNRVKPGFYQDAIAFCDHCKINSCTMPNVSNGLDTNALSKIYNLFDIYIQYAICEGFGMPVVEAAACGVPLAVVNNTSMTDFVKYLNAIPIDAYPIRELETNADRSGPNNDHLVEIMLNFSKKSEAEIKDLRNETYRLCKNKYDWDKAAQVWIDSIVDALDNKKPNSGKWNSGSIINEINIDDMPTGLNNFQFCEWLYSNLVQDPSEMHNLQMMETIRDLNLGISRKGGLEKCDQKIIFDYTLNSIYYRKLNYDKLRCGVFVEQQTPEFILEAHKGLKEQ